MTYLFQEEQKAQREAELENLAKNDYVFESDASYDLLCTGPAMRRERPDNVPALTLNGLPEYVTSSEEEEGEWESGNQQNNQAQASSNPTELGIPLLQNQNAVGSSIAGQTGSSMMMPMKKTQNGILPMVNSQQLMTANNVALQQ